MISTIMAAGILPFIRKNILVKHMINAFLKRGKVIKIVFSQSALLCDWDSWEGGYSARHQP